MNLIYKDYFKIKDKFVAKKIYINSFDKKERFPFWILKKCAKEENVIFNVIFDKEDIVGIQYIIEYDNIAYLMYFAVNENKRNKGYGTQIIKDIVDKYNNIVLSIERADNDLKNKRKNFYLENGFLCNNKFIEDNKVEYEILYTKKDFKITKELLEKRYIKMTNSKILQYIISKTFNVYNIEFIK